MFRTSSKGQSALQIMRKSSMLGFARFGGVGANEVSGAVSGQESGPVVCPIPMLFLSLTITLTTL
jgi:hypothetical protein